MLDQQGAIRKFYHQRKQNKVGDEREKSEVRIMFGSDINGNECDPGQGCQYLHSSVASGGQEPLTFCRYIVKLPLEEMNNSAPVRRDVWVLLPARCTEQRHQHTAEQHHHDWLPSGRVGPFSIGDSCLLRNASVFCLDCRALCLLGLFFFEIPIYLQSV